MSDLALMTEEEVAQYLRVKPSTLRNWRFRKIGPPYCKIGGTVRYRTADISEYMLANRALSHSFE